MPWVKGKKHSEATKEKQKIISMSRSLSAYLRSQDSAVGKHMRLYFTQTYNEVCALLEKLSK